MIAPKVGDSWKFIEGFLAQSGEFSKTFVYPKLKFNWNLTEEDKIPLDFYWIYIYIYPIFVGHVARNDSLS